jgi:hypothetical protein
MKKYMMLLLIISVVFLISCKDVVVYYPIPLTSSVEFIITTSGGSYSETLPLNTDDIFKDLHKKLAEFSLTLTDIDQIKLEGAAYTITKISNPSAQVSGGVDLSYDLSLPTTVMSLDQLVLGDIVGIPQENALSKPGVDLLNQALDDLRNGTVGVITVNSKGSLAPGTTGQVTFTMLVEFTITSVVTKKQSVFSPLG